MVGFVPVQAGPLRAKAAGGAVAMATVLLVALLSMVALTALALALTLGFAGQSFRLLISFSFKLMLKMKTGPKCIVSVVCLRGTDQELLTYEAHGGEGIAGGKGHAGGPTKGKGNGKGSAFLEKRALAEDTCSIRSMAVDVHDQGENRYVHM